MACRLAQVTVVACCSVLMAAVLAIFLLQTKPVYLVDFAVHQPPERCEQKIKRLDSNKAREASICLICPHAMGLTLPISALSAWPRSARDILRPVAVSMSIANLLWFAFCSWKWTKQYHAEKTQSCGVSTWKGSSLLQAQHILGYGMLSRVRLMQTVAERGHESVQSCLPIMPYQTFVGSRPERIPVQKA